MISPENRGWEYWDENTWMICGWRPCDKCPKRATWINVIWGHNHVAEQTYYGCDEHHG